MGRGEGKTFPQKVFPSPPFHFFPRFLPGSRRGRDPAALAGPQTETQVMAVAAAGNGLAGAIGDTPVLTGMQ